MIFRYAKVLIFAQGGVGPMADKSRVNILIRLPTDGNKVSACAENRWLGFYCRQEGQQLLTLSRVSHGVVDAGAGPGRTLHRQYANNTKTCLLNFFGQILRAVEICGRKISSVPGRVPMLAREQVASYDIAESGVTERTSRKRLNERNKRTRLVIAPCTSLCLWSDNLDTRSMMLMPCGPMSLRGASLLKHALRNDTFPFKDLGISLLRDFPPQLWKVKFIQLSTCRSM
jgi:hypothetical protein